MSLRLEMLQIARRAPSQLRDAAELVRGFLLERIHEDGGFRGRDGAPDLYYTVFGIDGLLALGAPLPAGGVRRYLESFGDGEGLDLVHLACLVRANASARADVLSGGRRRKVLEHLAAFRCAGGGYANEPQAERSTIYGCFLALGAYQDLQEDFPDPEEACAFVRSLETPDGAYSNDEAPGRKSLRRGSTPATAAAVAFLRSFGRPVPDSVSEWLLARCDEEGGFFAAPGAPLPDLLSTATALHALAALERPIQPVRRKCLDFLDRLWTARGSFYAHWAETELDVEYTFYGLLALGHLAEQDPAS